jgi:hypothetical protein
MFADGSEINRRRRIRWSAVLISLLRRRWPATSR